MPHVKFEKDYDHTWPSRAVTAFKAGWSGNVKDEVAAAAIKSGHAVSVERQSPPVTPPPAAPKDEVAADGKNK